MSAKEEAEGYLGSAFPNNGNVSLIYCRTAIFCSQIIAEAILAAAERVRVPYVSGRIGDGIGGGR